MEDNDNADDDSMFRIDTCSPQELVNALRAARGENETIAFLHAALAVSPGDAKIGNENSCGGYELGDELLSDPIETSLLSPRLGKFSLQFYENGLKATKVTDPHTTIILCTATDESSSTTSSPVVSHAQIFPKPEDCKKILANQKDNESKRKKTDGNLVLLRLSSPMSVPKVKNPIQQLCFALPTDKKLGQPIGPRLVKLSSDTDSADTGNKNSSKQPAEEWGEVIQKALGQRTSDQEQTLVISIVKPGVDFKSHKPCNSSSTTAGMPFVNCYLGVNDGVLYPLKEGLLFYKPPRFLPRSSLHSIACGRGGGGGGESSRYVDMIVQCDDDSDGKKENETVEFSNINREENSVLNLYIHDILIPAMKEDSNRTVTKSNGTDKDLTDKADDSDNILEVEAMSEDEDRTTDEEVNGEDEDDDDDDDDDDDFECSDEDDVEEDDDESDDGDSYGNGNGDEEVAIVQDEFAQELVKEKRRKGEQSETESEDDEGQPIGQRLSKRLRRGY